MKEDKKRSLSDDIERISVAEVAKRGRRTVLTYEKIVQMVGAIPELDLIYVENLEATRFTVDRDTVGRDSLVPGASYLAMVNEEGYALSVERLPG